MLHIHFFEANTSLCSNSDIFNRILTLFHPSHTYRYPAHDAQMERARKDRSLTPKLYVTAIPLTKSLVDVYGADIHFSFSPQNLDIQTDAIFGEKIFGHRWSTSSPPPHSPRFWS